eukprot:9504104-Pyramimonas_sp.AAC.1
MVDRGTLRLAPHPPRRKPSSRSPSTPPPSLHVKRLPIHPSPIPTRKRIMPAAAKMQGALKL